MSELQLFDGIGVDPETGEGITAKQFDADLKALGSPSNILLRINSPGGSVFDGMAIYSVLTNARAKITARIEGIAASAASLIAMAADRIEICSNAFMLVHSPYTAAQGTAEDLAKTATDLKLLQDQYAKIYSGRTGMALADVVSLMGEDRLMGADEAVQLGFADAICDEAPAANLRTIPSRYRAAAGIDDINPAKIIALSKTVARLTRILKAAESDRRRAIRDLGTIANRPRLAKKLIAEGISVVAASKRFYAANLAREAARKAEIAAGWDAAAAKMRGERPARPVDSWDAAIAKVFPHGR